MIHPVRSGVASRNKRDAFTGSIGVPPVRETVPGSAECRSHRRNADAPRCGRGVALFLLAAAVAAPADQLRNVQPGQALPPLEATGLDGKPVRSADLSGKVTVLVYLSARQRQSEEALASAHRVISSLGQADVKLVYLSADVDQADYFRQLRDKTMAHEPFVLDEGRAYYGKLGLIVFPTTAIADRDWKLRHVIASWTRDYEQQLEAYTRHARGEFDEAELQKRLTAKADEKNESRARAERHRAVAAVLRGKGLLDDAAQELQQALSADPNYAEAHVDLADLLVAQGKLDDAEKRLNELLTREPAARGARLTLGLVKLRRNQLDEAEKLLKEALLMNPDPVRAHYYLGQLYERKGDTAAAAEHYREGLKRALNER